MRILITVGTTSFDELIKQTDIFFQKNGNHEIKYQISNGIYKPISGGYFDFTKNISEIYDWADCIITHAGAGNIYKLLELNKLIIVVPNLNRVDKHQSDITNFIQEKKYGLVCWNLSLFEDVFYKLDGFKRNRYVKNNFFKFIEIRDFIKLS
ncbi:PssE/Cps14G family polysaccharide biosynthesis glycosyltransferase [Photobacterium carnosum]|uniref:PssE/Cps14G family polysaccharide biosynthesis glycosyltransferase n=1 Tax=Photobacterium carnosum TaxID=2023717 RepID=UPI001E42A4D6|nr:PssE/Cps14G family polysaccharide biosynthesis glycosyltransferase [Photobacterium carnosum]MCD9497746.1 glycosyltransferase [Photobacterium carnosum]